jgi:hypothetical protein
MEWLTDVNPSIGGLMTVIPLAGAGPLMTTVSVVAVPPVTTAGFRETDRRVGATTIIAPVPEDAETVAVKVTVWSDATGVVAILKVVLDDPIGINMEAGIVAQDELEASFTVIALLPVPATALRETVPTRADPPDTR